MTRRRLPIGLRLAAGSAAVLLIGGGILLAAAYVVVERASARYDRTVAEDVRRELDARRARLLPVQLGATEELPAPGEEQAERRATAAARQRALPAYRRDLALGFAVLLAAVLAVSLPAGRLLAAGALRRDRLQAAVESQRTFAAQASHELRTPLSVIRAEVDACLGADDTRPERWRASAEAVLRNVDRSERLVGQLLLLARAQAGPEAGHAVDLGEIAEALLDELPPDRPLRCELAPAPTRGDPTLIESAIANLLDNAVRHNVTAGGVELRSWTEGGRSCIAVASDGPRVDAAEAEALFEPFTRGTGSEPGGSGLGLAIVRAIAHAHAGTVAAVPRARGGLEVTLRLPSTAPRDGVRSGAR
jgi:signal transduction histidine kinase